MPRPSAGRVTPALLQPPPAEPDWAEGLAELSADALVVRDASDRVRYWSRGAERLYGHPRAFALGRCVHELLATRFPGSRDAALAALRRDGLWQGTLVQRHADGREVVVLARWRVELDPHGGIRRVLGSDTDIGPLGAAQDALHASEARFRLLADEIAQLVWTTDPDGRLEWCNRRALDFTGATLEELQGGHWERWHHPVHGPGVMARLGEAYARGEPWEETFPLRRADGAFRWFLSRGMPVRDAAGRIERWFGTHTDVTAQRETEEALAEERERLRLLVEGSPDHAIIGLDANGCFESLNAGARLILGCRDEDVLGRPFALICTPEDRDSGWAEQEIGRALANGRSEDERWHLRRDGSRFWASGSLAPLYGRDRRLRGFVKILRDATDRKQQQDRNSYLAHFDGLTGLANRVWLGARLHEVFADALRHREAAAVLLIDLDRFKDVNDTRGHDVGDRLLQEVARRLQTAIREGDFAARLGGDEFVVVQPRADDRRAVEALARKLRDALAAPLPVEGEAVVAGASIGIALFPQDGRDPVEMLKRADQAMYLCKQGGGNGWRFYADAGPGPGAGPSDAWLDERLGEALARGELALHYQPQIDSRDWRIAGMEALLRWTSPELAAFDVQALVRRAEANGLIVPLSEWVLRAACRQNRAWQQAGLPAFRVSVNVSPAHFRGADLAGAVDRALADSGLAPECLELEITEGLALGDEPEIAETLAAFRARGIHLAIDDFGTGYSSIRHLARLPFDVLKIDRSFVQHLPHNRQSLAVVTALLGMARSLGVRAITEGIETPEQLAALRPSEPPIVQGFLFCEPRPADEIAERVRAGAWNSMNRRPGGPPH